MDSPDCLLLLLSISVFTFWFFCFTLLAVGSVQERQELRAMTPFAPPDVNSVGNQHSAFYSIHHAIWRHSRIFLLLWS